MGLFQTSVLKKYRKLQDKKAVEKAYKKYADYFHNPERQQNIIEIKEEGFQQKFLMELFVNVFDYVINPDPNYNLSTEYKNEKGAKKADGAILARGRDPLTRKALAVIELKSTKTKDLESIRQQAFDYKANHSECVYVITSNFEKLRFYINNAVEFEEFNLFALNEEQFDLLYLCLHKENILQNIPLKIKTDSVVAEEKITKTFYSDYSQFKRELFRDLVKQNLKNEIFRNELQKEDTDRATKNIKQALFKKSQKLIDRFLFIFFAEDKGLLPPNSTLQILNKWKADWDFGDERPLYDLFKQYFKFLDIGRKGTQSRAEIFAYNGGLFKPDLILDSLILDNQTLFKHTKTLSDYDFESQVGVNILGHIFENSLNEIESVNAEIEGTDFDKQKTKRKKDGVFYTPKYITKYIVDNTVGKLCEEKKQELEIKEEEYRKSRKGRKTETIKKLKANLTEYRKWLLTLTILDPACGSGAFLNQALDFLIKEHTYIDELETSLFGGGMVFQNIENTILENNIFGVDINEESVEIAKLSLWLRTAQPRRKLNTLNNNIKCGNSLIDDPKVAGDKAFNWQNEFPHIFSEKKKKAWHITTATHNSRYSQRMFDNYVKLGNAVWLDKEDEIIISKTIAEIVKESKFNNGASPFEILEYNICGDHMHMLLVCDEKELTKIVGKIKSMTARAANIAAERTVANYATMGHAPLSASMARERGETQTKLWTQKFGKSEIKDENYLNNTIEYIRNNRVKHELPKNKEIEKLKKEFLCTREHAFRKEYNGGFDVVIGNPPYGAELADKDIEFIEINYKSFEYQVNSYVVFYEKGIDLTRQSGLLGYITPATFTYQHYFKKIRNIFNNLSILAISKYFYEVFEDADIGDTVSWIIKKQLNKKNDIEIIKNKNKQEAINLLSTVHKYEKIVNTDGTYNLNESKIDFQALLRKGKPMSDYCQIIVGIKPYQTNKGKPKQTKEIVKAKIFTSNKKVDETYINCIIGKDFHKYRFLQEPKMYLSYGEWLAEPRVVAPFFDNEKIILRQTSDSLIGTIDFGKRINLNNVYNIGKPKNGISIKYILGLLNSKLLNLIYQNIAQEKGRLFAEVKKINLSKIPIVLNPKLKEQLENKVETILENSNKQIKKLNQVSKYFQSQYNIAKLSNKLQNWHELEFADFIKELNKAIKAVKGTRPLGKKDEMEWMELFEEKKAEAQTLKSEIEKTDKEIDQMVYELYGLTEDEIKIIENE